MYSINNEVTNALKAVQRTLEVSGIVCDAPAASQYIDKNGNVCIDVAFVTEMLSGNAMSAYSSQQISSILDANGATFADPSTNDMNSFDQFV